MTQSGVTQSGVTQSGVTQSGVVQSGVTQSGVTRKRGCCFGLGTPLLWLLAALGYAASNALGLAWLVEDLAGLYQQSPGLGTVAFGVIAGIVAGLLTVLGFCVRRFPKIAKDAAKGAAAFCGCPTKPVDPPTKPKDRAGPPSKPEDRAGDRVGDDGTCDGAGDSTIVASAGLVFQKGKGRGRDTVVQISAPEPLEPEWRQVQA